MNNLAFVFPGQGSQSVGMINDLYEDFPEIQHVFSRASDVLNIDLLEIVQTDPNDILNHTEITQPALLTCSVAMWEVWKTQTDILPKFMAGHSLGEYSALVCSGVMEFEDAVLLTNKRGQYMQQAVPNGKGAMAAILGLSDEQVIEICQQVDNKNSVSAANFNSPGQVVISGESKAVTKASELAKLAGAKRVMPLTVSVPSHCRLMRSAAENLKEDLHLLELNSPTKPVIHNVNVKAHESPDEIKKSLVKQLYQSVKWTQAMEFFAENNITNIVECGPNKVLSGLAKRFNRKLIINNLNTKQGFEKALDSLRG